LNRATTRLLASGFVIATGVVLRATTEHPGLPSLALILTGLLERAFGLADHIAAHDLHDRLSEHSTTAKEVLSNHDLIRAVAKALQLACEEFVLAHSLSRADRKAIRKLGKHSLRAFQGPTPSIDTALAQLRDLKITSLIRAWSESDATATAMTVAEWKDLLESLAAACGVNVLPPQSSSRRARLLALIHREYGRYISEDAFKPLTEGFDSSFQSTLKEILKEDFGHGGKSYAGLQMLVWGELLSASHNQLARLESAGVALRSVDQQLTTLNESTSALPAQIATIARDQMLEALERQHTDGRIRRFRRDSDTDVLSQWQAQARHVIELYESAESFYPFRRVRHGIQLRCTVNSPILISQFRH